MKNEAPEQYYGDYRQDFQVNSWVSFEGKRWQVTGYYAYPQVGKGQLHLKTNEGESIVVNPHTEHLEKIVGKQPDEEVVMIWQGDTPIEEVDGQSVMSLDDRAAGYVDKSNASDKENTYRAERMPDGSIAIFKAKK